MTAPYTAADSSSVALAEEELAAILVRADNPPVDDVAMLHHAAELVCEIPRLVAELTRAREALRAAVPAIDQLVAHQTQLDEHGVMVGVSRQAVDEVVAAFRAALGDAFAEATASKEEGDGDTER